MSPVDAKWDESQPIYRQLRDRVVAMMLEGVLKEGEALPSVRQVATEYRLNPLTVLKAYQHLADEGLVEKRRGLGMFVAPGAGGALMKDERARFLEQDWPRVHATIQRLGLSVEELLNRESGPATPPLPTRSGGESSTTSPPTPVK
jgi:GntR family transcriptional regulator